MSTSSFHNIDLLSTSLVQLLKIYNPSPSKRLGQNFLIDDNIARKIVECAGNLKDKNTVEIGPGLGALSRIILKSEPKYYTAVEYDTNFLPILEHLSSLFQNKMNIINMDALKMNEGICVKDSDKITLISNLPYNISVILLLKWLKNIELFERFVLMFQKEVAERITAKPHTKAYGAVSVFTQYLCDVSLIFEVSKKAFWPEPNVDSAVIIVKPKTNAVNLLTLYPKLREVCNVLFNHRRKMIRNTLKFLTEDVENICEIAKLDPMLRPENLSIKDFVRLTLALS